MTIIKIVPSDRQSGLQPLACARGVKLGTQAINEREMLKFCIYVLLIDGVHFKIKNYLI